jgi:hypothetical protein
LIDDGQAVLHSSTAFNVDMGTLPPQGASPAGDLQRQVCNAALRGFFAEPSKIWHYGTVRRVVITTIAGSAGWGAVFGLGSLLLR